MLSTEAGTSSDSGVLCICIDSLGLQGRLEDNSTITGRQTLNKHQITLQPNQNQGLEAAHGTWGCIRTLPTIMKAKVQSPALN